MINKLRYLSELIKENKKLTTNVYFIEREKINGDVNYKLFDTNINKDINKNFLQIFYNVLDDNLIGDDIEFIEYNPSYYADKNEIEYIDSLKVPNFSKITKDIIELNLNKIHRIDNEFLEQLWAYCVRFEVEDKNIFYFRKYNKSKVITRKGLFAIFFNDGNFNKILDNLFLFDEKIDAFYFEDYLFILNKTNFELIFNYIDEYKSQAISFLQEFKKLKIVDINDDFVNWCLSDIKKVKKILDIKKNDSYKNFTIDDIKNIKQDFELAFNLDGNNNKIVIMNKKDIWEVLKVLNDDYYDSKYTKIKYIVQYKSKK